MVDRGGLENRCALAGTQGSNPCLSAKKARKRKLSGLRAKKDGMRTLRVRYRAALAKQEIAQRLRSKNPCLSAKKARKRKLSGLRAKKDGMRTLRVRYRAALAEQETAQRNGGRVV